MADQTEPCRRTRSFWAIGLGVYGALAWLLFTASFSVGRQGFSPDEEITALVVRGIAETGAPVLPSGMLYLRGLPYSYAAWLGGAAFGHDLVVYRGVSLVFALLAIALIFMVTRAVSSPAAGVVAALLFAASPFLLSAAVFARFYAAFVAAALFAIWLLVSRRGDHPARLWWFLLAVVCARLLHEWAAVLALLPLCLAADTDPGTPVRRGLLFASAASVVVLVGMQLAFSGAEAWSAAGSVGALSARLAVFGNAEVAKPFAAYFTLARPIALVAIGSVVLLLVGLARRATATPWIALAAYALCGFFFQLGALLAVVVAATLAAPHKILRQTTAALIVGGGSSVAWLVHAFASTDAAPSFRTAYLIAASTLGYPWEAVGYFAQEVAPMTVAAVGTTAWLLARAVRREQPPGLGLALFAFLNLIGLGLTAGEFQWRYLLVAIPPVIVLAAQFLDVAAAAIGHVTKAQAGQAAAVSTAGVVLCAGLSAKQLQYAFREKAPVVRSAASLLMLPTEDLWAPEMFRAATRADDVIVCNDEAACQYLLGRVDYWLQPSPEITSRYVTSDATDPRGVYSGARVLTTFSQLDDVVRREGPAVAIVMLDTGKFDDSASHAMTSRLTCRYGSTATRLGGYHEVIRIASDGFRPTNQGAQR